MEVWPGTAYPLGATFDGVGTNFAVFSEVAEQVELCLFDDARNETRVTMTEVDAFVWHCYLPSVAAGPALRLPGARHLRPRARVCAATRPSCCSTPTPRRPSATSTGTSRCSATTSATRTRATTTTPGAHMMLGVVINPFFDWEGDRRLEHAVLRVADLRGPRQGPHRAASRRAGERCAGRTPASRTRR